jgi:hypothetical protein
MDCKIIPWKHLTQNETANTQCNGTSVWRAVEELKPKPFKPKEVQQLHTQKYHVSFFVKAHQC